MSFKEISAWILIAANLIVVAVFAKGLGQSGGIDAQGDIFSAIILFVIIVVVAHIIFSILNPKMADTAEVLVLQPDSSFAQG